MLKLRNLLKTEQPDDYMYIEKARDLIEEIHAKSKKNNDQKIIDCCQNKI
jgi:hypothetical protein